MDKGLILILEDIKRKIEKISIDDSQKSKYLKEFSYLLEEYKSVEVPDNCRETYDSLITKGRELAKESNLKDKKKVEYYLRYCNAAVFDFKGNLKPLNLLVRSYLVTCILFLTLSPQYFPPILPILFILPIYLGLKGLKRRSRNGLLYSLSVMPMALLTSVVVLRSLYMASKDFAGYIASLAEQYNRSYEFVQNLTITFGILAVVMFAASLFTIIVSVKYRKMFI